MARWDDEGRGRGWRRDEGDDEAQRMRGRSADESWVGRKGFDEGRYGSNERYGYGSNEQRLGGERYYGPSERGERMGMTSRGYRERFDAEDERGIDRDDERGALRGRGTDPYGDDEYAGGRSYWGRGEDVGRSSWARDRDAGPWGYGSQDRSGGMVRTEGGGYVDRRTFGDLGREEQQRYGHVDDSRIRMSGGPRGSGLDSGYRAGGRFSENEEHGFREPPYRPGGFGHREHGRGGFVESVKSFFGKGPKNYVRSDERIREDICDRLTEDPMIDASHVDVEVKGGEVRLTGFVHTRHEKRRAEDLVEEVYGVKDVSNGLRLQREATTTVSSTTLPGTTVGTQGTTAGTTTTTTAQARGDNGATTTTRH